MVLTAHDTQGREGPSIFPYIQGRDSSLPISQSIPIMVGPEMQYSIGQSSFMCPPPPAPGVYQHGGVGEDGFALNVIEWISTGRRDPPKRDSGKRNTAAIHQYVHLVKLSLFP